MTMPVDGHRLSSLKISSDDTTGNLQELSTDVTDTIRYRPGQQFSDRYVPEGGMKVPGPSMPELEIPFRTNVALNANWQLLVISPEGERAFEAVWIVDSTNNVGIKIVGFCWVQVNEVDHEVPTRKSTTGITLLNSRPAGWVKSASTA